MLNLNNPVSFTIDEQNHISNVLKPLGKKGWSKGDCKTKKIKHKKIVIHDLGYIESNNFNNLFNVPFLAFCPL